MRSSVFGLRNVNGTWRSLVAHHTGGVGVAGSNPVVPTTFAFAEVVDEWGRCASTRGDQPHSIVPSEQSGLREAPPEYYGNYKINLAESLHFVIISITQTTGCLRNTHQPLRWLNVTALPAVAFRERILTK